MSGNTQKVCEYCGTPLMPGTKICPACDAKIIFEEDDDITITQDGDNSDMNPESFSKETGSLITEQGTAYTPETKPQEPVNPPYIPYVPADASTHRSAQIKADSLNETMRVRRAGTAIPLSDDDPVFRGSEGIHNPAYAESEAVPDLDGTLRVRHANPAPAQMQGAGASSFNSYETDPAVQQSYGMPSVSARRNGLDNFTAGTQDKRPEGMTATEYRMGQIRAEHQSDTFSGEKKNGITVLLLVLLVVELIVAGFVRPGWFKNADKNDTGVAVEEEDA